MYCTCCTLLSLQPAPALVLPVVSLQKSQDRALCNRGQLTFGKEMKHWSQAVLLTPVLA